MLFEGGMPKVQHTVSIGGSGGMQVNTRILLPLLPGAYEPPQREGAVN